MSVGTILLIILILILIGAVPTWQHSQAWGYGPSGIVGLLLVVLVVLVLLGQDMIPPLLIVWLIWMLHMLGII